MKPHQKFPVSSSSPSNIPILVGFFSIPRGQSHPRDDGGPTDLLQDPAEAAHVPAEEATEVEAGPTPRLGPRPGKVNPYSPILGGSSHES